jgi:cytidylate kinase
VIRTITFEREYGAGVANISQALAEKLGWKLWDQEITSEIARHVHCDANLIAQREERLDSMFHSLLKVFMRGSFEAQIETKGLELLDADHIATLFETVVQKIAQEGECVIVGRGAPWFLRHRTDAFHVFLYAPYEEKLRRTMAQGQSRQAAEKLLESVDRERLAFVRKYYGKEWPDRHLYNMMLNTRDGDEQVITTILQRIEMVNGGR